MDNPPLPTQGTNLTPRQMATLCSQQHKFLVEAAIAASRAAANPLGLAEMQAWIEGNSEQVEEAEGERYCARRVDACVAAFRALLASMEEHGISNLLVTHHPSYDLMLGLTAHDGAQGVDLPPVSPGDGTFAGYLWTPTLVPFYVRCWQRATGGANRHQGRRLVLFDNGMGDSRDIRTGQLIEPGQDAWVDNL